jgi:hypothetical protein
LASASWQLARCLPTAARNAMPLCGSRCSSTRRRWSRTRIGSRQRPGHRCILRSRHLYLLFSQPKWRITLSMTYPLYGHSESPLRFWRMSVTMKPTRRNNRPHNARPLHHPPRRLPSRPGRKIP